MNMRVTADLGGALQLAGEQQHNEGYGDGGTAQQPGEGGVPRIHGKIDAGGDGLGAAGNIACDH